MFRNKQQSTRLKKSNINLGDRISYYHFCSPKGINSTDVYYSAAERVVRFRVSLANGSGWYYAQPVPKSVKTVDALLDHLVKYYGCRINAFPQDISANPIADDMMQNDETLLMDSPFM